MKSFIGTRAMPDLIYHAPNDMDGLMSLLQNVNKKNGDFKIVAGCTDFIPAIRTGRWTFDDGVNVIDIRKVKELGQIKKEGNMLKIGACAKLAQVIESDVVIKNAPLLAQVADQVGSLQIRNTATIGGNICMSSPAADMAPALLVLDAKAIIKGPGGEQEIMLKDFFTGPGRNVLKHDQILTQITCPIMGDQEAGHFLKIGKRTAVIISIVSVAVRLGIKDGVCENPKIALGSVAPIPVRVEKAESFLHNKILDDQTIEQCANIASEEISPIADLRSSGEYRKDMAGTLVKRAILACRENLK
jgi:carbon-monoxide dehydrogenase medium subunit